MIVGIDGCRGGGWIVATATDQTLREILWDVTDDLSKVVAMAPDMGLTVVIDIPIGLSNEARPCDVEARKFVGPRRASSIFRPPCFGALAGTSYREASCLNRQHCNGVGLTIQAFGILQRIATVNAMMTIALESQIFEGHPEVSFRALFGAPLDFSKHKPEGIEERLGILRASGVEVDLDMVRWKLGRHLVRPDDVLDAAVCLRTASRIRSRTARVFPSGSLPTDVNGRRMAIFA
jgi:predicted RNase H-like nuclease